MNTTGGVGRPIIGPATRDVGEGCARKDTGRTKMGPVVLGFLLCNNTGHSGRPVRDPAECCVGGFAVVRTGLYEDDMFTFTATSTKPTSHLGF